MVQKCIQISRNYQNTLLEYDGKLYFTFLDFLYVFSDNVVDQVCQIPKYYQTKIKYSKYQQAGTLFTINNTLYMHNCADSLFKLTKDNKLKTVSNEHSQKYYYQFCDNLYCICANKISTVSYYKLNLHYKQIFEAQDIELISHLNSVLVLFCWIVDQNGNLKSELIILDMLDEQFIPVPNQLKNTLQYMNDYLLQDIITLSQNGMELKPELLVQLFGDNYINRIVQYQNSHINKQKFNLNFQNAKNVINDCLFTNVQNKYLMERNYFEKTQRRINGKINGMALKFQKMSSLFLDIFADSNGQ
ncbi:Hypothetical_protein [Hexamita inflata]|uniref:Hypothetical_protein n=1 Tax=Hexamita inflata TaxID=28002 RepID=A0AA86PBG0_9EUKA|nr:Hypothetical protein HINF_LOCUS23345 [Hexamita inflata]